VTNSDFKIDASSDPTYLSETFIVITKNEFETPKVYTIRLQD